MLSQADRLAVERRKARHLGFPHRADGGAYGRRDIERERARQRMNAVDPSESTRRMNERTSGHAKPAEAASVGRAEPEAPKAA